MGSYLVFDRETQNHEVHKRFANPFSEKNWTVALGWKHSGDTSCSWAYYPTREEEVELQISDDVTILVGHNIKFDLLYGWDKPQLKAFFKRGGKIWDTQYAEYLLGSAHPDVHMIAMDDIAEKYGGRTKIDAVKELWKAGVLTADIDKDMLIDYLVGTEAEERNSGDIGNTELIFLGQVAKAQELNMMTMIQARMDGLLATTEMEFNGLKIDVKEAKSRMDELNAELIILNDRLEEYIPEMPPELTFNWASNTHKSCLIFGGDIKYKKQAPYLDDKTGEFARYKAKENQPLFNGEPYNGRDLMIDPAGEVYREVDGVYQDKYTSGKNKGALKFKNVDVPGEIKTKFQDFFVNLPGYTVPLPEWQSSMSDGKGAPIYSTAADVITALGNKNIAFLKDLAKRQDIVKDLGTYYLRWDDKKSVWTGMLTCVMPGSNLIHHLLNHTSTVTTRLSSSSPNLQNIPRGDTSSVKKMFVSRWGDAGRMIEIDYSQLEVIVQALLSLDPQLCEDVRNGVDFHCKRVAIKHGITYLEAVYLCKDEDAPEHKYWKSERTKAKIFSFQRAYGAGAVLIAEQTGMTIDEVKDLIVAEELTYPGVTQYNTLVEKTVMQNSEPFRDWTTGKTYRRGYYTAPTGTRYTFRSYDAQEWQSKRGIDESFSPTEMKNYPVQGTGGEIVQIILGRLYRHFVANDNYGGLALLCNTVHDCVWFDAHESVAMQVAIECKKIMESVPEVLHELYGMDVPVPFPCEAEIGLNLYDKKVIHI